jgi:hypothetical protein
VKARKKKRIDREIKEIGEESKKGWKGREGRERAAREGAVFGPSPSLPFSSFQIFCPLSLLSSVISPISLLILFI